MKFTFDFDINDWIAFQQHHQRHSKIRIIYICVILFLIAMPLYSIIKDYIELSYSLDTIIIHYLPSIIFVFILSIFYALYVSKLRIQWSAKGILKKNPHVLGEETMIFDEDFFIIQSTNGESKRKWDSIQKVDETPDYFFLYLSTYMANVIPKKKIDVSSEDLRDFLKKHIPAENYKFYKK
ncbi:MAG: YcxB family protein [Candidatus Symbiothrix sp.]|jgi:hypothetical protein|nr:YcxB family protein [Candidatus Symbiothrix sp.]